MIKKSRGRWFWHIEGKDEADLVKWCTWMETEGTRYRERLRNIWWNCVKEDMKSCGLPLRDAQDQWRMRIKGNHVTQVYLEIGSYSRACQCVFADCITAANNQKLLVSSVITLMQDRSIIPHRTSSSLFYRLISVIAVWDIYALWVAHFCLCVW